MVTVNNHGNIIGVLRAAVRLDDPLTSPQRLVATLMMNVPGYRGLCKEYPIAETKLAEREKKKCGLQIRLLLQHHGQRHEFINTQHRLLIGQSRGHNMNKPQSAKGSMSQVD